MSGHTNTGACTSLHTLLFLPREKDIYHIGNVLFPLRQINTLNNTQLKGNSIPKGLVSLEHFFGRKDENTLKKDVDSKEKKEEHDKINIGTEENPKLIYIGNTCSAKEREKLSKIFIQY